MSTIATWFYRESKGEESFYPQVQQRSSSDAFADVYLRYGAVCLTTARRALKKAMSKARR